MVAKRRTAQTQGGTAQGKLDAKLLAYCAMATGALLAAQPAEAAVVYSGVKNLLVSGSNEVSVNIDPDTIDDIKFAGYARGFFVPNIYGSASTRITLSPLHTNSAAGSYGSSPFKMPAGASIAPGLAWSPNGGVLNAAGVGATKKLGQSSWRCGYLSRTGAFANTTGYIGVKFHINNKNHYAWIQYQGTADASCSKFYGLTSASATGTIIDWAYESTPETPIVAGDMDGDGIAGTSDNCPNAYNPQQLDADNDTIGDVCDTTPGCGGCGQAACEFVDRDGDGINDSVDNCPSTANPLQKDADSDGIGDACDTTPGCGGGCGQPVCEGIADTDGDYVRDAIDNCPSVFNPNQLDANGNGTGDCCDTTPGCGGAGQPVCDDFCSL